MSMQTLGNEPQLCLKMEETFFALLRSLLDLQAAVTWLWKCTNQTEEHTHHPSDLMTEATTDNHTESSLETFERMPTGEQCPMEEWDGIYELHLLPRAGILN